MKTHDQESPGPSPAFGDAIRAASRRQVPPDTALRCGPVNLPSPRALASIAIEQAALAVRVADLDLDAVHMTLGRDEGSGLIVAAALDAEQRSPGEMLCLFGSGSAATAVGLGAVWTCPNLPEVIVVDNAIGSGALAFHEAARELGIQIVHRPARALPGQSHLNAWLSRSGACRDSQGRPTVTMAVLVGAVHAWISACYADRGGRDAAAPPAGAKLVPPRFPAQPTAASQAHAWTLRGKAALSAWDRVGGARR